MVPAETIRRATLWTTLAVSAFASIEPSPYEFMFAALVIVFARRHLIFDKTMAPMILAMAIYNVAGLIALAPYVDESRSVTYTYTTVYISLTMIVFAPLVADRPEARMKTIRSGYVFAALIASALALLGYFDVAGLGPYFTLYEGTRAMGPFKDPNVFAPFLILPILWLVQDILLRRGANISSLIMLAPMLAGLGLSFSRGAVVDAFASVAMLFALTFLAAARPSERRRMLILAVIAGFVVAGFIAIAFAIPSVREMAIERASLTQDYDVGELGRFGNQIRAIPLLLERPLGFGPLRFGEFFPQDPHETFLSTFASYGWAGGLAFAAFTATTLYVGWSLALRRSPFQAEAIALWSACFPQILQGVQIDTEHWRHLYLITGCIYGLAAAARRVQATKRSSTPIAAEAAVSTAP